MKNQISKTAIVHTDTFLSADELWDLTGYKNPSKQCEQLKNQGIPFYKNARGYPRVCRENLIGQRKKAPKSQTTWQPKIQAA